jgi:hypothetical protein
VRFIDYRTDPRKNPFLKQEKDIFPSNLQKMDSYTCIGRIRVLYRSCNARHIDFFSDRDIVANKFARRRRHADCSAEKQERSGMLRKFSVWNTGKEKGLMSQADQHTMVHVKDHPNGEEEWYCPECGRRFLMHWPPEYKRTILEPGDEDSTHVLGKGGLSLNVNIASTQPPDTSAAGDGDLDQDDEKYMGPWQKWMDEVNFESLWDD